jgi:hypothetical protein
VGRGPSQAAQGFVDFGHDPPRPAGFHAPARGRTHTATSPLLPKLITEGDTLRETRENAEDAFAAVVEIYEDRELAEEWAERAAH